ncbi:ATP-binding protein [Hydrogenibacillus schlegelii]|uniref:ATP-binding protein n=1 Tax=Hydrogenibacillus schlegelii TaxID=1484 RepID=UPI003C6CF329
MRLCKVCKAKAVIELPQHNTAFCREHFLAYFENQVRRAIQDFRMFTTEDRILVAVSGGKDSLVLWEVLLRLGYRADGLYIDLGIGDYSAASREKAEAFAAARGATLRIVSLKEQYDVTVPELARSLRRPACSGCGLAKRYLFNLEAEKGEYDVLATGHNLDDEAATLFGNVLHWNLEALRRQSPVLEAENGFRRKVKPLIRLTERETAAYAILTGIDYIVEECPHAVGARSHLYKELLNQLELHSPGAKRQFLLGFYERGRAAIEGATERPEVRPCKVCSQPTVAEVCSFCRMMQRVGVDEVRLMIAAGVE